MMIDVIKKNQLVNLLITKALILLPLAWLGFVDFISSLVIDSIVGTPL